MPAPPPALPRLSSLLDQQLWFIGHDIRHRDGNALVRYGFERLPAGRHGSSCYRLAIGTQGEQLACWGFGFYVGPVVDQSPAGDRPPPPGVFVGRHIMTPRLIRTPLVLPLHQPNSLPPRVAPVTTDDWTRARAGVARLAAELEKYEEWARYAVGSAYRAEVIARLPRHKRRRYVDATDLAHLWKSRAPCD